MELKKTTKYDIKAKGLKIVGDNIIDESGEVVDIVEMFRKAFEDSVFDLSATNKSEEKYDLGATL